MATKLPGGENQLYKVLSRATSSKRYRAAWCIISSSPREIPGKERILQEIIDGREAYSLREVLSQGLVLGHSQWNAITCLDKSCGIWKAVRGIRGAHNIYACVVHIIQLRSYDAHSAQYKLSHSTTWYVILEGRERGEFRCPKVLPSQIA